MDLAAQLRPEFWQMVAAKLGVKGSKRNLAVEKEGFLLAAVVTVAAMTRDRHGLKFLFIRLLDRSPGQDDLVRCWLRRRAVQA